MVVFNNFVLIYFGFISFFISVLVQLLDQYLLGGVVPTRADLDHVFLRFGKRTEDQINQLDQIKQLDQLDQMKRLDQLKQLKEIRSRLKNDVRYDPQTKI